MKLFIRAYSVILLVYTGWRTYDFISSNLPKTDINMWLSLAFLFCTEIGLVLWHEANLNHTTTQQQETVSKVMTWLDFAGSLAAGIADMILRQTFVDGYAIPRWLADMLIYGLPIIMALNVGAVIKFEQGDAETQEEKAEKKLRFRIHQAAMKELENDRDIIAEEKKAMIYSKMRASVTGRIDGRYGKTTAYPERKQKQERKPGVLEQLFSKVRPRVEVVEENTPVTFEATGAGQAVADQPEKILTDAKKESRESTETNFPNQPKA